MLRGPMLRATVNRKMMIDGEFKIDTSKTFIRLPTFTVVDDEGKDRVRLNPGDQITFTGPVIRMTEHVAFFRPHPELFESGLIYYNPIIAPQDRETQVTFTMAVTKRVELNKLPYIGELFVSP